MKAGVLSRGTGRVEYFEKVVKPEIIETAKRIIKQYDLPNDEDTYYYLQDLFQDMGRMFEDVCRAPLSEEDLEDMDEDDRENAESEINDFYYPKE